MAQKKSFLLRIDNELWKALDRWAQEELRSINGQIEYILREAAQKKYPKKIGDKQKQT